MPTQKSITFYQCDICGKDYDTSAEATACENSHGTLAIYRAQYDDGFTKEITKEFPASLVITNGSAKAQYKFFKRFSDAT